METKKCSKCGEIKESVEFHYDKQNKDKKRGQCIICERESAKKYRSKNKDKVSEYYKSETYKIKRTEWLLSNPEKRNEYNKRYASKNKSTVKKGSAKYYEKNKEKLKDRSTAWKQKNPEKVKDRNSYYSYTLRKSGFTTEQINENPELIEVKRLIIKTKRLCKTLPTSEKA